LQLIETDILVVGAGGAGLRAAVQARTTGARVLLADKGIPGQAGTTQNAASDWMAFGAAFGHADPQDSPREHWIDILTKGGLACNPQLARTIAFQAPERLLELDEWGAGFSKTPDGNFRQILSDGARFPRACGCGAETGPSIVQTLLKRARWLGVTFAPRLAVLDLLVRDDEPRAVMGALAFDLDHGCSVAILSPSVILATGGAGDLYSLNAFPPGMTGDGYALALRAGVPLVNMEFIQIGPTIVSPFKFALSGVFWRLHPKITNRLGEEFIPRYIPAGVDLEEALHLKAVSYPFTVRNDSKWVDLAIFAEICEGRGTENSAVLLDLSHNPPHQIEQEAPVPLHHLLQRGLDIRTQAVEFAPAIQHFNGGILINERAETSLPGLFACGEAAGAQHGADRPGGNALADSQVFGKIAGESAALYLDSFGLEGMPKTTSSRALQEAARLEQRWLSSGLVSLPSASDVRQDYQQIRSRLGSLMWRNVSVVRTEQGLAQTLTTLAELKSSLPSPHPSSLPDLVALVNSLTVAQSVATAARLRTESRGTHYRPDCPEINSPAWQGQIILTLSPADSAKMATTAAEETIVHSFLSITIPPELGDLASELEPKPP